MHDAGEQDGWLFIATELVPDGDMQVHLDAHGPADPGTAVELFRQVCAGVEAGHDAGVLHRDVKPSNVLLRRQPDGSLRAIVCDFGIAAVDDSGATTTHGVIGTWGFLAPERHEGAPASVSSDVYALGCLLWALLVGEPPYPGTHGQQVMGHLTGPLRQLDERHPDAARLNPVLARAMAKSPNDRYPTAMEIVSAMTVLPHPASGSYVSTCVGTKEEPIAIIDVGDDEAKEAYLVQLGLDDERGGWFDPSTDEEVSGGNCFYTFVDEPQSRLVCWYDAAPIFVVESSDLDDTLEIRTPKWLRGVTDGTDPADTLDIFYSY